MSQRRATNAHAAPRAVLFDAFGTLFDVHSVALLAEQCFPGQGQALSRMWRDKQLEYAHLVSASAEGRHYQPFWALTQAALRYSAACLALELPPAQEQRFMNQYRALSTFPEVREVLKRLKERGIATGVLSNADPDMLAVAVKSAGLEPWLDHLISVAPVRRFKPHPDCYALGPSRTGVAAQDILFVSSNGWDAQGAAWFGYPTLWVNRQHLPPEPLGPAPTRTGSSLREVLDFFAPG